MLGPPRGDVHSRRNQQSLGAAKTAQPFHSQIMLFTVEQRQARRKWQSRCGEQRLSHAESLARETWQGELRPGDVQAKTKELFETELAKLNSGQPYPCTSPPEVTLQSAPSESIHSRDAMHKTY
jgi:hypothetical protein